MVSRALFAEGNGTDEVYYTNVCEIFQSMLTLLLGMGLDESC